ncbi:MAG: hypothetical protein ABIP80_06540, partial [Ferruginibacter sp.]
MEINSGSGKEPNDSETTIDMSQYQNIEERDVEEMVNRYRENVKKDPAYAIMQITMDSVLLKLIMYGADRIVLLAASDSKNVQTVILQLLSNERKTYYNIRELFNEDMPRMGRPPVCPPPPDCGFPPFHNDDP